MKFLCAVGTTVGAVTAAGSFCSSSFFSAAVEMGGAVTTVVVAAITVVGVTTAAAAAEPTDEERGDAPLFIAQEKDKPQFNRGSGHSPELFPKWQVL